MTTSFVQPMFTITEAAKKVHKGSEAFRNFTGAFRRHLNSPNVSLNVVMWIGLFKPLFRYPSTDAPAPPDRL
jgi:hypothetical protein